MWSSFMVHTTDLYDSVQSSLALLSYYFCQNERTKGQRWGTYLIYITKMEQ